MSKQHQTKTARVHPVGARVLAAVAWLVAWQLLAWYTNLGVVMAGPYETALRLFDLVPTTGFWASIALSLGRVALGFGLACALGTVLAIGSAACSAVRILIEPALDAVRAVPVASFVVIVLLWVPSVHLSIVVSMLMALPIVFAGVLAGIDNTSDELLEVAQVFGVSWKQRVRGIYLPQVMPHLQTALSLATGLAWKAGLAAEVIGMPAFSVGRAIVDAKNYLDTPSLFAWTFAVVVVALVLEVIVSRGMKELVRRQEVRP